MAGVDAHRIPVAVADQEIVYLWILQGSSPWPPTTLRNEVSDLHK
jgi:hypothetical protein